MSAVKDSYDRAIEANAKSGVSRLSGGQRRADQIDQRRESVRKKSLFRVPYSPSVRRVVLYFCHQKNRQIYKFDFFSAQRQLWSERTATTGPSHEIISNNASNSRLITQNLSEQSVVAFQLQSKQQYGNLRFSDRNFFNVSHIPGIVFSLPIFFSYLYTDNSNRHKRQDTLVSPLSIMFKSQNSHTQCHAQCTRIQLTIPSHIAGQQLQAHTNTHTFTCTHSIIIISIYL